MTKDFFKFERDGLDFPLYNDESFFTLTNIIILLIGIIIIFILPFTDFSIKIGSENFEFFIIPFIFLLLITRGKLSLVWKKFKKSDIKVIILCLIADIILTLSLAFILKSIGITGAANSVTSKQWTILGVICFVLQMLGEEIVRFLPFLLGLTVVYKFTENRKLGMVLGFVLSGTIFGLMHMTQYHNPIYCLIAIGFGSIVLMFAYFKTKNLLVSTAVHLAFDMTMILAVMIGHVAVPSTMLLL